MKSVMVHGLSAPFRSPAFIYFNVLLLQSVVLCSALRRTMSYVI